MLGVVLAACGSSAPGAPPANEGLVLDRLPDNGGPLFEAGYEFEDNALRPASLTSGPLVVVYVFETNAIPACLAKSNVAALGGAFPHGNVLAFVMTSEVPNLVRGTKAALTRLG